MQCEKCGCEKFEVIKVFRNKKWDEKKSNYVFSNKCDTRKIICAECQSVYYTETIIIFSVVYDEKTLRNRIIPAGGKNEELF